MPAFGNQAARFSFGDLPKHRAAALDGAAPDVLWYRSSVQDRDGKLPAGRIGNMGELVAGGEKAQPDHTGKDIAAEDGEDGGTGHRRCPGSGRRLAKRDRPADRLGQFGGQEAGGLRERRMRALSPSYVRGRPASARRASNRQRRAKDDADGTSGLGDGADRSQLAAVLVYAEPDDRVGRLVGGIEELA